MEERSFLGTAATPENLVPPVDPAHLKKAWEYYSEIQARHPGQQIAVGGLEHLFPPGTDAQAVGYRSVMLTLLLHVINEPAEKLGEGSPLILLRRCQHADGLDDAIFKVMARIRLERMERGAVYQGWPCDMEDFIKQVQQEAA